MADPRVPKVRRVPHPVNPNHQTYGSFPEHGNVPVPGGDTNIQYKSGRGSFSVNDHRIERSTPRHAPTKE